MNSTPASFDEWIMSLGPGERFPLTIVALALGTIALILVVTIVTVVVYKMHKNRMLDSLKRELLERGMSAEEIAMVVQAKPGSFLPNVPPIKPLPPLNKGCES